MSLGKIYPVWCWNFQNLQIVWVAKKKKMYLYVTNRNIKRWWLGVMPILKTKFNVSTVGPSLQRETWLRLSFLSLAILVLFIFWFVSQHCLHRTLCLFYSNYLHVSWLLYFCAGVNCSVLNKAGFITILFKILSNCGHKRVTTLK